MKVAELLNEIEKIDPADAPAIMMALAARLASTKADEPQAMATDTEDTMLTTQEAAAMLKRSVKWLYRHHSLPFARKIGPRSYVWSRNELQKWLSRRRA